MEPVRGPAAWFASANSVYLREPQRTAVARSVIYARTTVTHHSDSNQYQAGGFRAFGAHPPYATRKLLTSVRCAIRSPLHPIREVSVVKASRLINQPPGLNAPPKLMITPPGGASR